MSGTFWWIIWCSHKPLVQYIVLQFLIIDNFIVYNLACTILCSLLLIAVEVKTLFLFDRSRGYKLFLQRKEGLLFECVIAL